MPLGSDEVGYYKQVEAAVKFGAPLGFYGYNDTHAIVSTFGAWGFIPLLPYILIGKLFGWSFFVQALSNLCFICFSIFAFLLITRPKLKSLLILAFFLITATFMNLFSYSGMVESLNYLFAIIMAALFTKMILNENSTILIKVFLGLLIFYAVLTRYSWSVLMLPFSILIFRKNYIKGIIIGIIATFTTAFLSIIVNKYTGAPYFESTFNSVVNLIIKDPIGGTLKALNDTILRITGVFSSETVSSGVFYFTLIIIYLLLILLLLNPFIDFIKSFYQINYQQKTKEKMFVLVLCTYTITAYIIGIGMFYTSYFDAAIRSLYLPFLFCIMLMINFDFIKEIIVIAGLSVISLSYLTSFNAHIPLYPYSEERKFAYFENQSDLNSVIHIDPNLSRWENTVNVIGANSFLMLSLPEGTGINFTFQTSMLPDDLKTINSKYCILNNYNIGSDMNILYKKFIQNGFVVLLKKDDYVIYLNPKYININS